jgi:antirestriction protein ArdC
MVFTFQPPFWAGLSGYVAEMGSAFLCASLGIVPTVRHADYLAGWLDVLREDNRAIFRAAAQARDRKSTRLNSSHRYISRMPSSA